MSSAYATARPVIVDRLPRVAIRDVLVISTAVLFTALAAQVVVPLPFTPVPISGQTFAVLVAGAALGPARGVTAMGLYLVLGLIGLPFYAEGSSGPEVLAGATGGYLAGFVVAAGVVGWLARRGFDRKLWTTVVTFTAGSVVVYVVGVPWLAAIAGISLHDAIALGVVPFLVGDAVKAVLAGAVMPLAWRLVGDAHGSDLSE